MIDIERFAFLVGESFRAHIQPLIERVKALEVRVPERGEKGERGDRGIQGAPGLDGHDGRDGKDGESVTLDTVLGLLEKVHAEWALDFERRAHDILQRTIDRMPKPNDGKDGRDGYDGEPGPEGPTGPRGEKGDTGERGADGPVGPQGERGVDGFSLDDLAFEQSADGRTLTVRFMRGDLVREVAIEIPAPTGFAYRGVYSAGDAYEPGDAVTWGGSLFIAQCATKAKPETNADWRLAVKRGRDGRDGKDGARGEKGEKGDPGRDATNLGPNGGKW